MIVGNLPFQGWGGPLLGGGAYNKDRSLHGCIICTDVSAEFFCFHALQLQNAWPTYVFAIVVCYDEIPYQPVAS